MKNDKERFRPLDIELISSIIKKSAVRFEQLLIRDRLAMNLDMAVNKVGLQLFDKVRFPLIMKDYRLLRILAGEARLEINFTEHVLVGGDVLILPENTYVEILEIAPDTQGQIMAFVPERHQQHLLQCRHFVKRRPTPKDWDDITLLLHAIYSIASSEPYRAEVADLLAIALLRHVATLPGSDEEHTARSAAEMLYARFMAELAACRPSKQPVAYYADRLCVTPQYLSKAVTQVSGKTASEWIDKAVVLDARILLRDPTKTVSAVADALGFPNDSYFCRYFRRQTGQSPTEYRRSGGVE
ncbi:MAG: AraC family transcriptional regulator [Bacteroidaceae bacterium]|nr:AraC family transcriptional regulator [Bacteroidaceae bacterium]